MVKGKYYHTQLTRVRSVHGLRPAVQSGRGLGAAGPGGPPRAAPSRLSGSIAVEFGF